MGDLAVERTTLVAKLRRVRWVSAIIAIGNLAMILFAAYLLVSVLPSCSSAERLPFWVVLAVAAARIVTMVRAGMAQQATAETIAGLLPDSGSVTVAAAAAAVRHERRMRYKRWLWWTRISMAITVLQFIGALYLMFVLATNLSYHGGSEQCFLGQDVASKGWKQTLVVSFLVLVWLLVVIQCFTGSDVLRWRSFYATHDTAWRAHYQEVFDHGIREALCCLGRVKYLSVLEEDEVYYVAQLLGDLVAYRASGTGHLELLAGLALLQRHKQVSELNEAPESQLQEAAFFHQFAEAAYTGPLLDFGRNPILFPCAWLYRQGVLTPWTRNRRPVLEGDNWWRGHAAAFLKYVNLSPDALRQGRVRQTRREAAYFIVVLHDQKSIVIAVRGTETPEDLLTDGLCRECSLSMEDLGGLINSDHLSHSVSQRVLSSFPHYGHSGIVESARELFMQIDGYPRDKDDPLCGKSGFLSSLLGVGCECHGYKIRVVGHSLGGAVAALVGLRLYQRYPNLHVYSYGTLPCVDSVIAEACSDFVTTIVYNDEFSARLSVNSVLRLRAAAITALSDHSSAESAIITKIAQRILLVRKRENGENHDIPASSLQPSALTVEDNNQMHKRRHIKYTRSMKGRGHPDQGLFQKEASSVNVPEIEIEKEISNSLNSSEVSKNGFCEINTYNEAQFDSSDNLLQFEEQAPHFLDDPPSSIENSTGETPEMYLPGLIVHIVPEKKGASPLWKSWKSDDKDRGYKAYLASRENFKDLIVTPYMFLDHLPWRCHYALQRVLETRMSEGQLHADMFGVEAVV